MRKLSTVNTARVYDAITRPVWLVDILFATPLYLSSRGAMTYDSRSYVAAGLQVSVASASITLVNDALSYSAAFLAGATGVPVRVHQLYGEGAFATGDADLVLSAELGTVEIGETIRMQLRETPQRRVPRLLAGPPGMNFIPPPGFTVQTPNGTYVFDGAA